MSFTTTLTNRERRPFGCGPVRLLQMGIREGCDYPGEAPSLPERPLVIGCRIGTAISRRRG